MLGEEVSALSHLPVSPQYVKLFERSNTTAHFFSDGHPNKLFRKKKCTPAILDEAVQKSLK